MKHIRILQSVIAILLCLTMTAPALADALTLPQMVEIIDEEAFYGSTSIDKVVLSDKVTEIRARAFANSTLTEINLPDSLTFIAEDAFDGSNLSKVTVNENTYAWEWASEHGYLQSPDVSITGLTYTYPENNLIVGSEFDLGIDHVAPEGASVTPYAGSENVEVTEDGHVRILDEGTISIKFRDADGEHEFFSEPVKDVFCFYHKFESGETEDYIFGTTHPGYRTKAWGRPLNYHGGDTSSVSMLVDFFDDTLIVNAVGLGDWNVSVVDGADWITLKKESGSNTYIPLSTVYSAAENQGAEERTGHIRFTLGKYEYTYEIKQAGTGVPEPVEAESIALDEGDTLLMYVGEIRPLHATVLPENTTDKTITWTSGDESVVQVDSEGVVTAVDLGSTDITAETANGISASCRVEVVTRTPFDYFVFHNNDDGTCSLASYIGPEDYSGDIEIPRTNEDGAVVTSIDDGAFRVHPHLTGKLSIPDSVTSIGNSAFEDCNFTGSLVIPDSVISIGEFAFENCSGFTGSLVIPDNVIDIGQHAFSGCNGFTGDLTIGNSVISIGEFAFDGCNGFTGDLTIGNSVISIGDFAFGDCYGFSGNLTLGNHIESIGDSAFQCKFTGNLTIPDSVKSIGKSAFSDCDGFTGDLIIGNNVLSIGDFAFSGCTGFDGSLILGNNVTSIGKNAFDYCKKITDSVSLPDSVISIGAGAFACCEGLTEFIVSPQNTAFSANDGVLFSKDGTILLQAPAGKQIQDYSIPATVTIVSDYAFEGCEGFTGSLTIPTNVTSIGRYSFARCYGLSNVTILNDTVSFGNSDVFLGCEGLTVTCYKGSTAEEAFSGVDYITLIFIDLENVFHVTVKNDQESYALGSTAIWTAEGFNGVEPYKYRFYLYRDGARIATRAYNTENTYSYTFTAPGSYHVVVSLKDDDGNTVEKTSPEIIVAPEQLKIMNVVCDHETIRTTDSVTWTATAAGGEQPYQYNFTLKNNKETVCSQDYSNENTFSYTFEKDGTYQLEVTTKDKTNTVSDPYTASVNVALRPVEITGITADADSAVTESTITWTVETTAGKAPYTYDYEVKLDGVSQIVETGSSENTFTYHTENPGECIVTVTVTDAAGNTDTQSSSGITIIKKDLTIDTITAAEEWVKVGDAISWTVEASGGVKPLRYAFDVFLNGEEIDGRAFNTDQTFAYEPDASGDYTVKVRVRDASNTTVEQESAVVHVYDPISVASIDVDLSLIADPDKINVQTGEPVIWTAAVNGGKGEISYDWFIYYGEELEYSKIRSENIVKWTPIRSGAYSVKVCATDENGDEAQLTGGNVSVNYHAATPLTDFVFHLLDGNHCEIEAYTGKETTIVLPGENADGLIVRQIKKSAFENNKSLVSVTLSDNIDTIDQNAFKGCTSLFQIVGGSSLTDINGSAFSGCSNLTSVVLQEGLKTIHGRAFKDCTGLESIHLPNSVVTMNADAFQGCLNLVTVNYPLSWAARDYTSGHYRKTTDSPFYDCPKLTHITIPDDVSGIPANAFCDDTSLRTITFPLSLKNIGAHAFEGCSQLNGIDLSGIEQIGENAFAGCVELSGINLTSASKIDKNAFEGCNALKSVHVPSCEMGVGVFTDCKNIEKATLDSRPDLPGSTFSGCDALKVVELPEDLNTVHGWAFRNCISLESIHLPDSIVTMNADAFQGCKNLVTVNYPKKWATKGSTSGHYRSGGLGHDSPFYDCPKLTHITIPDDVNVKTIPAYAFCDATSLNTITIPLSLLNIGAHAFDGCVYLSGFDLTGIDQIGEYAFAGCAGLRAIDLTSVSKIDQYAFEGCNGLRSVHIPSCEMGVGVFKDCKHIEGATFDNRAEIPGSTFYGCEKLGEVELPEGLDTVHGWAFKDCISLESIHLPDSIVTMNADAFQGCLNLEIVNYPLNWTTKGYTSKHNRNGASSDSPFYDCPKLTHIAIPDTVQSIPANAFCKHAGLNTITIPESLKNIGAHAFDGCTFLRGFDLSGIDQIGEYAFAGCAGLTEINLTGVSKIDQYAFKECERLQRVHVPSCEMGDGVFTDCKRIEEAIFDHRLEIPESTFSGCEFLKAVELQEGLQTIQRYAFRNCTSLESVHLPDSIVTMDGDAFQGCISLITVNYPRNWTKNNSTIHSPFYKCPSLVRIFIPEGASSIPANAFNGCSNLRSISVPSTLTSIGNKAFTGCSSSLTLYNVPADSWIIDIANKYGIQTSPSPMDIVYGGFNGRVIDENNDPVPSVAVFAYPYGSANWSFSTETDADGRWSISNVPTDEQYQIRFYAEGYDFDGRTYQFAATYPSNNIGDIIAVLGRYAPERTLSGKVTIASVGDPLSGVHVSIYDSASECVADTSTDNEGKWMVAGLIENEDYSIQYSVASYSVNAASQTYKAGSFIEAEASLSAESDSTISFIMKQNGTAVTSIQAGTTVDFAVTAPNAAYIRLVADGIPYEEHEVVNGTAAFSRLIASSRGGVRTIQMQAYSADNGWLGISEAQTLNVISIDKLAAPTLSLTDSMMQGADFDVSWSSVDHAEKYTVYVFGSDSIQYYPSFDQTEEATTTALHFTVPANAFCSVGKYSIQVVATGVGYDSATGTREVTVVGSTDEEGLLVNSIQIYAENIDTTETAAANAEHLLLGAALGDGISNSGTLYAEGDVIRMTLGERKHISEVVKPASALNKDVSWSIIQNGVVMLDENAQLLTAVAPGNTKLIVTAKDRSGIKSVYDISVDAPHKIHDAINNTYINNGDTLILSPNMKVGSEYTLQVEAQGYWNVSCSDESWLWRDTYSGYGNSDLKIKVKSLPETNQTLTSTITVTFADENAISFNVIINGGRAVYNGHGKTMKYLMKYRDPDGVWHAIQDNETIYIGKNLKAGDKIRFSMDCDQYWKWRVIPVSNGGANVSGGPTQSDQVAAIYLGFNPQSTFDLTVIAPPGKGSEWKRACVIKDSEGHIAGSFTICLQYPEPQFYFTSEDNALLSIEDGTIQFNPSVNRPVRFHVTTASPLVVPIIEPPTSTNGSPVNWLSVSYENLQKGGYAQGASFDLVFQVKQRPGAGQTYSAAVQLHGFVGFTGYDYYGYPAYFVDDVFTVKITGE